MEGIVVIASSVFLFLIVAGFFLGFARDWCKSLIRFSIVVIDFIFSLLVVPLVTGSFINKYVNGSTITLFSYKIDFNQIAEGMFEANLGEDLNLITGEVEIAARSLLNVAVNIALFIAVFFVILILSLIIYWIVVIVVKNVNKRDKEKKKQKSHISTRFIGGFEGALTTLVISFVLLIPLFGAMNICNNFLRDNETSTTSEPVASALSTQNVVAGQLYYTEDKQIGIFENYIEKYAYVKGIYDNSVVGKIFNFTKLGKAGSVFFDYLTRVNYKDEKVKFSDEITVVIETYNIYKETFKDREFDITNNESLDNVAKLSETITKSKVATNMIEQIMPQVLDNWSRGEKFLGVQIPSVPDLQELIDDAIEIAKTVKTVSRINYNVKNVVEVAKILNNYELIASVKDNTIFEKLENNETVVKEVVLKLSETDEFSNNLPILLDDLVEVMYKKLTNENDYENLPKDTVFEIEDWESEAEKIQNIVSRMIKLYNISKAEEQSEDNTSIFISGIGELLDNSKESVILSQPVKNFIISYIGSDKFANEILDEESKNKLINYINEKWDTEEESFKFKKLFGVVSKIVEFSNKFANNANVDITELKETLEEIILNESLKEYVIEFIEIDVLDELVKKDDFKKVALDLFKEVIYNSTEESLDNDIGAGQALIDLANQENQFDSAIAEEKLIIAAKSQVFMDYINETSTFDGKSNLQKVINSTLSIEEKAVFISVIDTSDNLTSQEKEIFNKLFLSISL